MKKIYYSQDEAKQAVKDIMAENANYTVKNGSLELDYDMEESDSFRELVHGWSGETAAYVIEDENGETVARIGYWGTESVELARARRDVDGAVATWNADPFSVEGESIEGVAEFITREDVDEKVINDSDVDEEEWANLAAKLDLNPDDTYVIHTFTARNHTEQLIICYEEDHQ